MGNFGTTEIILIVAVLFLLFGASRLPQLAKSLGQTRKAFKEGMHEAEEEERIEQEQKKLQTPPNTTTLNAPQVSTVSDEELLAEMRRRAEVKQQ
ncbi:MAG: Sec-independent protein translocase subunit TatA/TatB [Pyrinomonadaceae bacterium]